MNNYTSPLNQKSRKELHEFYVFPLFKTKINCPLIFSRGVSPNIKKCLSDCYSNYLDISSMQTRDCLCFKINNLIDKRDREFKGNINARDISECACTYVSYFVSNYVNFFKMFIYFSNLFIKIVFVFCTHTLVRDFCGFFFLIIYFDVCVFIAW